MMGYYDAYNAILSVTKSTPRDSFIDLTKRNIQSDFKNNISYYQVPTYLPSTPLASTPLDVWITDDSKLKDQKRVSAYPNQEYDNGYLLYWKNSYWLTVSADKSLGDIYSRGTVTKCYSSLKWLDSKGEMREAPFTYRLDFYRGEGMNDDKVLIMPSERRYIYVQQNEYTYQIAKNKRFIFDGRAWKITAIDRTFSGLIYFELEENQINEARDNIELRIADYYAYIRTIQILNGPSVYLVAGTTLQLNVHVKDNGIVTSEPVTYTSSDETIATVDVNGLVNAIMDGNVTISAMLANDNTVTTSISVSVSAIVTDNYSLAITGSDSVLIGQTQSYIGSVNNNGVVEGTKTVVWTLYGDDGVSATTLANIVSQDGTSCTVKANSNNAYGYIKLVATCSQDGSINATKRIQIKGIF